MSHIVLKRLSAESNNIHAGITKIIDIVGSNYVTMNKKKTLELLDTVIETINKDIYKLDLIRHEIKYDF